MTSKSLIPDWLDATEQCLTVKHALGAHYSVGADMLPILEDALRQGKIRAKVGGRILTADDWAGVAAPTINGDEIVYLERASFRRWLSQIGGKSEHAKMGGRPTKYDWAGAAAYAACYIVENDYPEVMADLVKAVKDWFTGQPCGTPEDAREIERFVSAIYGKRLRHGT